MRIDFASLAFGYRVRVGGATPNWATSLGQGKEYKINDDPAINEILKGVVYSSIPLSKVTSKIGKGGRVISGDSEDSPIVLAGMFSKVYINDTLINNGKYILLITRDTSESHSGRLRLKYGPSNTYVNNDESYSNETFLNQVKKQFDMSDDACWFISDIRVINQNELVLRAVIVNPEQTVEYEDSKSLHAAWKELDHNLDFPIDEFNIQMDNNDIDGITPTVDTILLPKLPPRSHKKFPLNCILYGAPGTGKTYATAQHALAIVENRDLVEIKKEVRSSIMERYNLNSTCIFY